MSDEPQSDTTEPTEEDVIESIVNYAVAMLRDGKSREVIEAALMAKSIPPEFARQLTGQLFESRANAVRQMGRKHMGIGAAWCIGGAVLTWATLAAAQKGGTYVVFWGAIIFGGLEFLYGLRKTFTAK